MVQMHNAMHAQPVKLRSSVNFSPQSVEHHLSFGAHHCYFAHASGEFFTFASCKKFVWLTHISLWQNDMADIRELTCTWVFSVNSTSVLSCDFSFDVFKQFLFVIISKRRRAVIKNTPGTRRLWVLFLHPIPHSILSFLVLTNVGNSYQ